VFFHQLRKNFVLSGQLGFKLLDLQILYTFLRTVVTDKCSCSVFKKLLLPVIEDPGLKMILVT
jgi:hypothetical protein